MRMLPNIITMGRLFAVPVTVYFILVGDLATACWIFVAAGVSDAVDGAIARLFNARTILGGFLDPLADKALLVSVYLSLAKIGLLPLWLVILVVFRDMLLVGGVLLSYTLSYPVAIQPNYISKFNTLAQLTLAALVLAAEGPGLPDPLMMGYRLSVLLQGVVGLTTVLSGAVYLARSELLFGRSGRSA